MTNPTTVDAQGKVHIQNGNFNLRTAEWVPGLGAPKIGDKSIDNSWVFFQVAAESQMLAEAEVRRYAASPLASFDGMQVTLNNGVAHPGNTGKAESSFKF